MRRPGSSVRSAPPREGEAGSGATQGTPAADPAPTEAIYTAFNTILVIEAPEAWPLIDALPHRAAVVMAQMSGLNSELLLRVAPDLVAFPLFAKGFDAFDGLARLTLLNYRGSVGVIAPPLPNRPMVEAELRSHAPGMQVCLVETAA